MTSACHSDLTGRYILRQESMSHLGISSYYTHSKESLSGVTLAASAGILFPMRSSDNTTVNAVYAADLQGLKPLYGQKESIRRRNATFMLS